MPDLDLAEEEFTPHWMFNPVPEESGINEGKNDTRTAVSYEDYTALRAKGWETVRDVADSHTNDPDPEPDPEDGDEDEPDPEPNPD